MSDKDNGRRCVIISADGHCGAELLGYRPYLEHRYLDEFDAWAPTYRDPWGDVDALVRGDERLGVVSYSLSLNWDSTRRLEYTDGQGIAAEVLFPNTTPPFAPSGVISAPGPRSEKEFEYRFAGLKAHNRWLADFCADARDRRAGFAQIFLDDIDAAIAEVTWAKEAGLKGVLLPNDHMQKMEDLFYPRYDPLWAVCADLDLPVHRHGITPAEIGERSGPAATWVGNFEIGFYGTRAISHLICAGVFERFPKLKFVTTEIRSAAVLIDYLQTLDTMYSSAFEGGIPGALIPIDEAVSRLSREPSSYFKTNCYIGGPMDLRAGHDAGVPNLMFGADIPHAEGTAPYTKEALRLACAGLPDSDIAALTSGVACDVYGFELEKLQGVANRIGPLVEELKNPLPPEEWPEFPQQTRYPLFAVGA
jgi:predicted TIM-barrel fold metal-dependent hydrolase